MSSIKLGPSERYYKNLSRTDKEAMIMKQYTKEFESNFPPKNVFLLNKQFCELLGNITLNEFYKKQIIWGGEYPGDVKQYEEITLEDFYTGKPKQLNLKNEYYDILRKISETNNIPTGEINLNIRHDTDHGKMSYTYLIFHPRYHVDINEILSVLHAKVDSIGEDSSGYIEYKLIIQDQKFEEILYQGQEEIENIKFNEKDYEWLWEENI